MTDDELKQMIANLAIAQDRTDEQLKVTNEVVRRTSEEVKRTSEEVKKTNVEVTRMSAEIEKVSIEIKRVSKQLGHMGESRGEIAEEFFYRSLDKNPQIANIHFDSIYRHWSGHVGDIRDEYDVILVNGDKLLIVEVKARANINDIKRLVNKKVSNFRVLFPFYKDHKIMTAIASLTSSSKLVAKAKELGAFFLTQQGNHIALINDEVKMF